MKRVYKHAPESPNVYEQTLACIRSGSRAPQAEGIQKAVGEPERIQASACCIRSGSRAFHAEGIQKGVREPERIQAGA